jgi:outer membrane receptor protein involved in Fe transport
MISLLLLLILAPSSSSSNETVVTAPPPPPHAPREDQAAAATVVIPGESPRAYDDLGQLVLEVPGVTVTRSGSFGSTATLSLRGSSPDEVRIYLDGVPLNLAEGGAVDIATLPLGDVERVEVYRGSTPLAFAESALGGIVSITTRTPGTPRAAARAGGGSFRTMFGDVSSGGSLGPLRLYAGAHAIDSTGGFGFSNDNCTAANPADDTPGDTRQNNDLRQADGVVRAALDLPGRRALGLGLLGFARDQGLPGSSCAQARSARFKTARGVAYLSYDGRDDLGPGGRLAARLFASAAREVLNDQDGQVGGSRALTRDTTTSFGATVHAVRPLASWLGAAAILEGRDETFQPVNKLRPMPDAVPARRLVGVAGGELDLWWRRLALDVIPSARLEAVRDVATERVFSTMPEPAAGSTIDRALPILRLALVRAFGPAVSVKANVGRYARIPTFLELYGDTARLVGNAGLRPERGTNADLALWLDAGRGRVQVASRTTGFAARVDDLIAWQISPWQSQAQNVSSARVLGVEQELRLTAGRHARLVAQATWLDAVDTGPDLAHNGRQVAMHPRWHAYARPELAEVALGGALLAAFVDGDLRAGYLRDAANIQPLPTRLLIGAGVVVAVPRWGMKLTASGLNLNDSRTADLSNWPLPGRSIFVALAWERAFTSREQPTPIN